MHRENVCQQPLGGSVPPVSRSLVSPSVVSVLIDAASARSFQPEARLATLTGLEVNSSHQKWSELCQTRVRTRASQNFKGYLPHSVVSLEWPRETLVGVSES